MTLAIPLSFETLLLIMIVYGIHHRHEEVGNVELPLHGARSRRESIGIISRLFLLL